MQSVGGTLWRIYLRHANVTDTHEFFSLSSFDFFSLFFFFFFFHFGVTAAQPHHGGYLIHICILVSLFTVNSKKKRRTHKIKERERTQAPNCNKSSGKKNKIILEKRLTYIYFFTCTIREIDYRNMHV